MGQFCSCNKDLQYVKTDEEKEGLKVKKFDEKTSKIISVIIIKEKLELARDYITKFGNETELFQLEELERNPPIAVNYLFELDYFTEDESSDSDTSPYVWSRQDFWHHTDTWIRNHCKMRGLEIRDSIVISEDDFNFIEKFSVM